MSADPSDREPLDVALAMLTMVPGGMGGSETYARALVAGLGANPAVRASVVIPESVRGIAGGERELVVGGLGAASSVAGRLRTIAAVGLRSAGIRRELARFDVVHYPFTVPAPAPPRSSASVQSLHDVQHLELPGMFSRAELVYRRRAYEGFARRADAVITMSDHAKRRMVEILGIPPEKIHVAHLGVDTARFSPNLGEREPFLLYPARGWPHKNHARLVEAVGILRTRRPELRLVLTGGDLDRLGPLPDWVERRGLVSDDELQRLYRSAAALVFPSLYEGFGLPPIEAMASGCVVAVSDAGPLPEIVGDAGVRFDPYDPEAIADGIERALDRASELVPRGLERAARFTWAACVDAHVAAYRHAAAAKAG